MKLNKDVQYALLLVIHLAKFGKTRLVDVSGKYSIPFYFLEQIGRRLRLAGVLISHRGPGGGYTLAETVKVRDVLKALNVQLTFLTEQEEENYRTTKGAATELLNLLSSSLMTVNHFFYDWTITNLVAESNESALLKSGSDNSSESVQALT